MFWTVGQYGREPFRGFAQQVAQHLKTALVRVMDIFDDEENRLDRGERHSQGAAGGCPRPRTSLHPRVRSRVCCRTCLPSLTRHRLIAVPGALSVRLGHEKGAGRTERHDQPRHGLSLQRLRKAVRQPALPHTGGTRHEQ